MVVGDRCGIERMLWYWENVVVLGLCCGLGECCAIGRMLWDVVVSYQECD